MSLRPLLVPIVGSAMCLAAIQSPMAAAGHGIVEQFVAQAVGVSGGEYAGRIDIYIERWSTDEELDSLRAPLMQGAPGNLLSVLVKQRRRAGVVLMPGLLAHGARARTRTPRNLLFARAVVTPAGRRVVVASYEHMGLGETGLEARKSIAEFNLLEIRFDADGTGVGKLAAAAGVVISPQTSSLEVGDYATRPVRLTGVRSDQSRAKSDPRGPDAATRQ